MIDSNERKNLDKYRLSIVHVLYEIIIFYYLDSKSEKSLLQYLVVFISIETSELSTIASYVISNVQSKKSKQSEVNGKSN